MGKKKGQKKGGNLDDEWYESSLTYNGCHLICVNRKDDGPVPSLLDQAEMTGEDSKQKLPDVGKRNKLKKTENR